MRPPACSQSRRGWQQAGGLAGLLLLLTFLQSFQSALVVVTAALRFISGLLGCTGSVEGLLRSALSFLCNLQGPLAIGISSLGCTPGHQSETHGECQCLKAGESFFIDHI